MDDFLEFIVMLFIMIVICFTLSVPLFLALTKLEAISCYKTATILGYKSNYDYMTGCIVKDKRGHNFMLKQLREVSK